MGTNSRTDSTGSSGVHSKMNKQYRKVGNSSSVDGTLFASSHPDSTSRLRKITMKTNKKKEAKVLRKPFKISQAEFQEIKARTDVLRANMVKNEDEASRKTKEEKAMKTKDRIIALEKERRIKMKQSNIAEGQNNHNDFSLTKNENNTLKRARLLQEEGIDQVKVMRRKMLYAQCAKVRELQIKEKEFLKSKESAVHERLDKLMELDRLQKIKEEDEIEKAKTQRRRKDLEMIQAQLVAKAKLEEQEEELRNQERTAMLEMIRRQEQDDREKQKMKALEGKELLKEVLSANNIAVETKKKIKEREAEEDARILLWQEQKRIQEARLENEKLLIQKQKDKEFYEVAAQMKKSEDGRSEQDAARAKKYQIEEMKKKIEREENERRRQQEITEDLQRTRREQALKKLENLKILAIQDKKEWDRLNKQSSEVQKKAEEEDMKQRKMNQRHQKELIEQIKLREEINMKKKVELVEEGQRLKRENDMFIQKVKQKKKEILGEMRNNEIPEKYCADVARMRITIS